MIIKYYGLCVIVYEVLGNGVVWFYHDLMGPPSYIWLAVSRAVNCVGCTSLEGAGDHGG